MPAPRHPSFSARHGERPPEAEITIRREAPADLRFAALDIATDHGVQPSTLRATLCRMLRVRPDPQNWSEYPNIWGEVQNLADRLAWHQVYDLLERVAHDLAQPYDRDGRSAAFQAEINDYFRTAGVGWQFVEGMLEVRGPEAFETAVRGAAEVLGAAGRDTVKGELREALADLSRRPAADLTGAVQHAMGALECVARDVTGDRKGTLGEILKRHPGLIPKPLDAAIDKAWGYASERARHVREGETPTPEEAELVVGIAASVATYLSRRGTERTGSG
jgi:hypothetical protein